MRFSCLNLNVASLFECVIITQKISRLDERCLRLIYNDKKLSFEELMEIDRSASVHDRNYRTLATGMYEIYHDISPTIMNEMFTIRHQNQYNFRY